MPLFINLANLAIPKSVIEKKYLGGKEQFEKDYKFDGTKRNGQDNELYVLVAMNCNDFDETSLHNKGLHISEVDGKEYSKDYAIVSRYGGAYWENEWLFIDGEFLWHKDANSESIKIAKERGTWTVDEAYNSDGKYFESIV